MFFYFFLDNNKKTLYLCNVFFIVLDLRLTKLEYSGTPFFISVFSHQRRKETTFFRIFAVSQIYNESRIRILHEKISNSIIGNCALSLC